MNVSYAEVEHVAPNRAGFLADVGARWPLLALGFIALVAVPALGNDYWFSAVLIPFLALSLAGLGLNLLTGYAGQLSLGSAAFMAVGAFASYNFALRAPG